MLKYTVAIQPDDYGDGDASSPLWKQLLVDAGHEVRFVNVYSADIMEQIWGCRGFMWRHGHTSDMRQIARRLLPVLEKELDMVVYPDQNTCWYYDDKVSQRYLLEAVGIPIPKTWVWFDAQLALEWARSVEYPLVIKLCSGASSSNVGLVSSFGEARMWIEKLFGWGVYNLRDKFSVKWPFGKRRLKGAAKLLLRGEIPTRPQPGQAWELHKNYVLFQEFLEGNSFDHRIVVIGNRAFGFRRFNNPNDFRASGSGLTDVDPENVDIEAVRLAFQVARKLGTQSIGVDCLRRGEERVVGEVSYTYPHWTVHKCPGHWELANGSDSQNLIWKTGQMWPEEAQISDFLLRLSQRDE